MFKNYNPSKYTSYLLLFLPLFFALFMNFSRECDTWFLLSHGRYVLENGIPHTEILSMHSDFSFMMQQWLTSTVFYSIYKVFGNFGLYMFYLLVTALITYLLYKLCMIISNKKIYVSVLVTVIIMLIVERNYIEVRPQIISYVLLLSLLILLEMFYKNKSSKLINLLPVVPLLLINFHSAFYPMFIIVCLPYLAEYLLTKDKRFIKLIILILLGICLSLINPYGIDALMYGVSSFGVGNTSKFVLEMSPFDLGGNYALLAITFLGIFLLFNTFIIYFKNKDNLNIHVILLLYGFFFMGLIALKNMAFFYLFALPFISGFINIKDGNSKYVPYSCYIILGLILISIFGYNIYNKAYVLTSGIEDVVSYLDKNASKDIIIYADYHHGSYIEFDGYKPYIDSRAEVYLKKNNKKEDILIEYCNLLTGDLDLDKFIDKYNFDYIMVNKDTDFYKYIKNNELYELVYKGKNKNTVLFKRKI